MALSICWKQSIHPKHGGVDPPYSPLIEQKGRFKNKQPISMHDTRLSSALLKRWSGWNQQSRDRINRAEQTNTGVYLYIFHWCEIWALRFTPQISVCSSGSFSYAKKLNGSISQTEGTTDFFFNWKSLTYLQFIIIYKSHDCIKLQIIMGTFCNCLHLNVIKEQTTTKQKTNKTNRNI